MKSYLEQEFQESFGRNLGEKVIQEVLNEGNVECNHRYIFYINNAFDGQAWWCDNCRRHERMDYSPEFKIKFPANALISTPNLEYGGESFYAFKTDKEGIADKALDKKEWVKRDKKY